MIDCIPSLIGPTNLIVQKSKGGLIFIEGKRVHTLPSVVTIIKFTDKESHIEINLSITVFHGR